MMIFCVEDDSSIRELVLYTLHSTGFEGKGFSSGKELFAAMEETMPQLIILDLMLPGEDGITILKKLKASSASAAVPVMIATAKGSEYDKVIGLDTGADDYLVKPFGMMEMISRIKAILRRSSPGDDRSVISLGEIKLDKTGHRVRAAGKDVTLTLKEFDLLLLLMENPGRVFSREQLLCHVWRSEATVETRTVDVHIGTLRTKLGSCGKLIRTVRGVGYKMEI